MWQYRLITRTPFMIQLVDSISFTVLKKILPLCFKLDIICKQRGKKHKCVRNVSGKHDCARKSANTIQVRTYHWKRCEIVITSDSRSLRVLCNKVA